MYDIVTCQADKQVICEPAKDLGHPVGNTTRADVEDLGEWDETGSGRRGGTTASDTTPDDTTKCPKKWPFEPNF